jgi:hypothetical protein
LRRHYASLTDAALLDIAAEDLVDDARRIYEEELGQRKLKRSARTVRSEEPDVEEQDGREQDDHAEDEDVDDEGAPDWLEDAAVASTFYSYPGTDAGGEAAADARLALESAGIPCHLVGEKWKRDERRGEPEYEYRLMVPGKKNMEAQIVLDQRSFNQEFEDQWRGHFEELSDEELREVDLKALFGGLRDRMDRISRAYADELAQRGID